MDAARKQAHCQKLRVGLSCNVRFFKAFASKPLFWHLVKVGPDTQDLTELLDIWTEVKKGSKYEKLREVSQKKSAEVAEMKRQVTLCRRQVLHAKWRGASKKEYDDAVAAHDEAKLQWKALNRTHDPKGMNLLFDDDSEEE